MRQVVSYKRLKTMKNVKPFAPMQRVVAVNRLRKAREPGGGYLGHAWVNFPGYVPLASQSPYPLKTPF